MAIMKRGRSCCAMAAVFLALLLLLMCSPFHTRAATTYVVGDSQGWGFTTSYTDWADGKSFAVGDTLLFSYQAGAHNVVPVSAAGYKTCKASSDPSKAVATGNDKFTLKKGPNYYICSLPGHCAAGMRLQVNAD